jgi:hypothetical protein
MLTDLRVKLRSRRIRIMGCGFVDFLPLAKQFFAFVDTSSVLKSVIAELLARNQTTVAEVNSAPPHRRVYGETAEAAATIAYLMWHGDAAQTNGYRSHLGVAKLSEYKEWYVEPLFEYLDETLDDANIVLALLIRYKHKVEWYRRDEVREIYEKDTARGETNLKEHLFEFLFDQGLPFHVEPTAASGKPDIVSLDGTHHPLIGEVKVFDPDGSRGASYIRKAFSQAYRYAGNYNEPVAYLIVFNVSKKQLRVELPSEPDGVPRFELNHRTIFLVTIDLQRGSASTMGVAETVTITASELTHEVEESSKSGS